MTKSPQRANCHFIFSVGLPHTQESYTISLTRGKHSRIQAEGKEEVGRSGWEARRSSGHGSFQQRGRGGQKTTRVLQDSTVVSGRRFLLLEVGILLHALDLGMHE